MAAKKSFRVYLVPHEGSLLSGVLMRQRDEMFDRPPPSAIGTSEEDVLRQLELQLQQSMATGDDHLEKYLWQEEFQTREVTVVVHPQSVVKKRTVIGEGEIPLRLTFAWCALEKGGFRVVLPRFGWWFVLESLSIAPEVLRHAVATVLLGSEARTVYDFRHEGSEWVRSWSPRGLSEGAGVFAPRSEDDAAFSTVRAVAEDWVERAAKGRLPAVVGESDDFTRALPLLELRPLPSIVLVGPTGVGKTTWVRRLARALLIQKRAANRSERRTPRLWASSPARLVAGMTWLGMWQERCYSVLRELAHEGDYLYLDRLVALLQPQPDGASLAELLLPAARDGSTALIVECTDEELEHCRRKIPSLLEPLRVVRVQEPLPHRLPAIVSTYLQRKAPSLTLHPSALRRLIHHLAVFQRDVAFPGKAVRFIDQMAATLGPAPGAEAPLARTLYPADVSSLFAKHTGLPVTLLADESGTGAAEIAAALAKSVVGQPEACATGARVIARFKAGLDDPERPVGALLFAGPTGVGKTELARTLARYLYGNESRMVRLDMSEYMFPGSGQRLLEVGSGVTSLAQRVREQPLSLVLFDEIEKAHPEVFDLLLGVLGEGRLTDSFGSAVDFRMTVVVMTSNLGVSETRTVGFEGERSAGTGVERAVRDHFRPEFFNRIDHVVGFRGLSPEDVRSIVDLELAKAAGRTGLVRRNLALKVSAVARDRLAELGWHPTRGARPLKRVIEERVVSPVAELLARDTELRDAALVVSAEGEVRVER